MHPPPDSGALITVGELNRWLASFKARMTRYFRALKLGNASQVAPVDKLSVVLVAIFGVIFLSEKLSWLNWLGVCMMAVGALLVAML